MAVAAAQEPVSGHVVGNAFVSQYYHILHHSPEFVHKFYQDVSTLGRPDDNGTMTDTTTLMEINLKILSLNYDNFRAVIKSVDSQTSYNSGVHVLVTGVLIGKDDNATRNFAQSFFLAPQEGGGYFVLNDLFRYVENPTSVDEINGSATDVVETSLTPELELLPVEENHVTEETTITVEEPEVEGVHAATNGEVTVNPVVVDSKPVAEVVEEVKEAAPVVVESPVKTEDAPKKTYASIVMDLKGSKVPFTNPARTLRKIVQKSQEPPVKVAPVATSAAEVSVSSSHSAENLNNDEGDADGFSVYIKGLPSNATAPQLEEEFKKYGLIKSGGIQVRSNRQQGFCFGFVEYEELSSVQKAIEASPVTIGTKQAVVEEKKSTNSRSTNNINNNRGRFTNGRGYGGFRNDGNRGGRGANDGAPRAYNRGEFNGGRASEFSNNRGYNRGRSDGYLRADSNGGGRINRGGGMANGTAKNMPSHQTAAA